MHHNSANPKQKLVTLEMRIAVVGINVLCAEYQRVNFTYVWV